MVDQSKQPPRHATGVGNMTRRSKMRDARADRKRLHQRTDMFNNHHLNAGRSVQEMAGWWPKGAFNSRTTNQENPRHNGTAQSAALGRYSCAPASYPAAAVPGPAPSCRLVCIWNGQVSSDCSRSRCTWPEEKENSGITARSARDRVWFFLFSMLFSYFLISVTFVGARTFFLCSCA